jgi:hypothetical protein
MRPSAIYHPPNAFVISASLDAESLSKLKELERSSGMSRSRLIRSMIMATAVKSKKTSLATVETQEQPKQHEPVFE